MHKVITYLQAAAVGAFLGAVALPPATATVIVSDDLNPGPNLQQTWPGRTPDIADLPGGVWGQVSGFNWGLPQVSGTADWISTLWWGAGNTNINTTGMAIPIASAGSYTKPAQFTISADLFPYINSATVGSNTMTLGFFSSGFTPDTYDHGDTQYLTGLRLDSTGGLTLVVNGSQVGSTIAYDGTFDTTNSVYYTLSYTVNTTDGSISNISLEGSNATYDFSTKAFTDDATAYAGIYAAGPQNANGSGTRNFLVASAAVPEPASLGLLALGAVACLGRRRRA